MPRLLLLVAAAILTAVLFSLQLDPALDPLLAGREHAVLGPWVNPLLYTTFGMMVGAACVQASVIRLHTERQGRSEAAGRQRRRSLAMHLDRVRHHQQWFLLMFYATVIAGIATALIPGDWLLVPTGVFAGAALNHLDLFANHSNDVDRFKDADSYKG